MIVSGVESISLPSSLEISAYVTKPAPNQAPFATNCNGKTSSSPGSNGELLVYVAVFPGPCTHHAPHIKFNPAG